MIGLSDLAIWLVAVGYPVLLIMALIFGMAANDYAKERERYFQETLRLEERLHHERVKLEELKNRLEELRNLLEVLRRDHRMIREDIEELKALIEELKKEKCKVVEVVSK